MDEGEMLTCLGYRFLFRFRAAEIRACSRLRG